MDVGNIFGSFPERPSNPDFWRISSILLKLDGRMEAATNEDEKERAWADNVARWVDEETLNYSAMQRAFRPLSIQTRGDLIANRDNVILVILLNVMWQEGFQVGAEFATEPLKGNALEGLTETELRLLLSNYEKHVMERARMGKEPLSVADFFNSFHSE